MNDIGLVITIINLITLVGTLVVAIGAFISQRTHNFNSVKPIMQLDIGDYEDDIYVRIYNSGVGPGIINSIEIKKRNDGSIRTDLISYFENLNWEWDTFNTGLEGYAISPNTYIYFIEMKDPDVNQKQQLRNILKDVHIKIIYSDIYGNKQLPINTTLEWFGRESTLRQNRAKIKRHKVVNYAAENINIVNVIPE